MDFSALLAELQAAPEYRGQLVYVREVAEREARYAEPSADIGPAARAVLAEAGVSRLYSHQAAALDAIAAGHNVVVATGTASGKSLCFVLPLVDALAADPHCTALLLYPTKALCQDQFTRFSAGLRAAGLEHVSAGVVDGDTPAPLRRSLRDSGRVIFSNPDMLHAAMLPAHGRWARFLSNLRFVVADELHTYYGIFGSNAANLFRRLSRLCQHYGSSPQYIAGSATIANPAEHAQSLVGPPFTLVDDDGSPQGKRLFAFWNPPLERDRKWRARRSANVEAHELMAMLIARDVPTITFSKAKMTAEMIHRYVTSALEEIAPGKAGRVAAYRAGYLPEGRREIERRLFSGELLGVSSTRALELGIDVGGLDASIIVGYPGTLASFYQQAGRAGRRGEDALVILVGLDTPANQYVMSNPEYLFGRPMEAAVLDRDNPYVVTGHLRCAAQELPIPDPETAAFGPWADTALHVLEANAKVRHIAGVWYHATSELPQHEVPLRDYAGENVTIEDVDTSKVIGELNVFDASAIIHPEAIYMHQGDTWRVLSLDLERNLAKVKRVQTDYYTQPLGGTDVHHVDSCLRERPFGAGLLYWGEVTAYFQNTAFEKVRFYELDAISVHALDLPRMVLETMALWIVPPEEMLTEVRAAGLDVHAGLRGIGYATRMMLPLHMTCDTLDFSHSIGSANSPWQAIFIYERYPHGIGLTEHAFEILGDVLPAVVERLRTCPCEDGCPCCVGKPLRGDTVWNVERGEGSIPSKAAARMILERLLGDGSTLHEADRHALTGGGDATRQRIEAELRRRLERGREPREFHRIVPVVPTALPGAEREATLKATDSERRITRRSDSVTSLRKRLAQKIVDGTLPPDASRVPAPPELHAPGGVRTPRDFPGKPGPSAPPVELGDSLANRARRLRKQRDEP